jgi:hypothetical protein
MAPKPKQVDQGLILSVAAEVARTEKVPSRTKVANRLGLVASTMNKRATEEGWVEDLDKILHAPQPPKDDPGVIHHADGSATVVSEVDEKAVSWTREGLLEAHGFNVDEWVVVRARANRWGDPEEPSEQLRVDVVPKAGVIELPDPGKWQKPPRPRKARQDRSRHVVICGDHHAPFHDKKLHALFLRFLADTQPEEGILLGDLLDFATISTYREREGFAAPVNEGLQAAFELLRDYRDATPDTHWTLLPGNHDARLQFRILDNVKGLHKIAAADDDVPALDFRRLLHLDDLGIDFIAEDWDRARTPVTSKLTARHGATTGKSAGDKLLTKFARSTIQGHTHRLSLTFRSEHAEDDGEPTITRLAAEAGCMAEIADGLGYANDPDWQQGFLSVTAWPDGDFHVAPCSYIPGRLLTPGKRYA